MSDQMEKRNRTWTKYIESATEQRKENRYESQLIPCLTLSSEGESQKMKE